MNIFMNVIIMNVIIMNVIIMKVIIMKVIIKWELLMEMLCIINLLIMIRKLKMIYYLKSIM